MSKQVLKKILTIILIVCYSSSSFAHSGRTDSSGCHNDNVNGGYHCHNGGSSGGGDDGGGSPSVGGMIGGIVVGLLLIYLFQKISEKTQQKQYTYKNDYLGKSQKSDEYLDHNNKKSSTTFNCDVNKYCHELSSCDEARFYLDTCVGSKISNFCEAKWCTGQNP